MENKKASSSAQGAISARNAGLVLLNNYIPILFKRLDLLSDKKFKNDTAQTQAVHYLQYLATGLSHTEEALLQLNKVLCGLALSHPVGAGIEISAADKELIDGLLKATIGYWPEIGAPSIAGFRGNWLLRDGLLTDLANKWELTVEKRAYDLLIHRSPFSFAIIKYPWMQKALHVNWAY